MITFIKQILRSLLIPSLYIGSIGIIFSSALKNARYGLYLLALIIPHPNVYYKLHDYPYGHMLIDLTMVSVFIGIALQKINKEERTGNEKWIIFIMIYSYFAIWNSSFRFNLPAPFFTGSTLFVDWKNYIRVMLFYFIVCRLIKNERDQKIIILIITVSIFVIAIRAYRNFSGGSSFNWDKRLGGPFEACGLGANHFGAFIAVYTLQLIGLYYLDKNKRRKILFLATAIISIHPLLYSYSRGAYLGYICGLIPIGILKTKKILILLLLIIIGWQIVLPVSVIERITMTENEEGELENSSAGRIELWKRAISLFQQSPVFGVGYNGFSISEGRDREKIVSAGIELTDTHNYFIKVLCEQGLIGLSLILIALIKAFMSGLKLFRIGNSFFNKGLGLGFIGCVIGIMITNLFGDRFSYIVSGCYFWILFALVDRGIAISYITKKDDGIKSNKGIRNIIDSFIDN